MEFIGAQPENGSHGKRDFGTNAEARHGSLIEDMYGVERREDQPHKKMKTNHEKERPAKGVQFGSGGSGLGEWMKENQGKSASSTVATDIVDLTAGMRGFL